jgi:hypothetical protein
MKKFYKDLKDLQAKYPMCYIEAWTPEDYDSVDADFDDDEKEVESDWKDQDHIGTTNSLYDSFDANYGTNWDRIRESK